MIRWERVFSFEPELVGTYVETRIDGELVGVGVTWDTRRRSTKAMQNPSRRWRLLGYIIPVCP